MKHLFSIFGAVAALAAVLYYVNILDFTLFAIIEISYSIYLSVFYYLNFCK
jgi:hypothetical protein